MVYYDTSVFMRYDDCCADYKEICKTTGGVFCPAAPKKPEDRRENGKMLKIVAWNVDWLFTNVLRKIIKNHNHLRLHMIMEN